MAGAVVGLLGFAPRCLPALLPGASSWGGLARHPGRWSSAWGRWLRHRGEDAYKIGIHIDDEPANLDILDTAGQAEFTAMRDQYMRAAEGFIICYSIMDHRSFHEVWEFKQLIKFSTRMTRLWFSWETSPT
ncbi:GTP-binding protein Rit1 [Heterocephalus glaber]|uniref:GTP-binding protein Rit1 n=1 Tax=Heterocephalus glaber TaxID=10181 RepID=G5BNT3_HETGA|nr:GTP-binding protein Rit1 [Heterocephalus glaber]